MNTLIADIDYLYEAGLISRTIQPHDRLLKIQQRGVDTSTYVKRETSVDLTMWTERVSKLSKEPVQKRMKELEHKLMERKASFRYDTSTNTPSKKREKEISKSVRNIGL